VQRKSSSWNELLTGHSSCRAVCKKPKIIPRNS